MPIRLLLKDLRSSRCSLSLLALRWTPDNRLLTHRVPWLGRRVWLRFPTTSLKHQDVKTTKLSTGNTSIGRSESRRCQTCKHKCLLQLRQLQALVPLTSKWLVLLLRTTTTSRRLGPSVCRRTAQTDSPTHHLGRNSHQTHHLINNTEVHPLPREVLYVPSLLPSTKTSTAP